MIYRISFSGQVVLNGSLLNKKYACFCKDTIQNHKERGKHTEGVNLTFIWQTALRDALFLNSVKL